MAKKGFGKFIAFAAIAGVIAAGISYFTKYKSFHDELEEDFHDFEGDDDKDSETPADSAASRNYVSLNPEKDHKPEEPACEEAREVEEEALSEEEENAADAEESDASESEEESGSQATTIEDDITE